MEIRLAGIENRSLGGKTVVKADAVTGPVGVNGRSWARTALYLCWYVVAYRVVVNWLTCVVSVVARPVWSVELPDLCGQCSCLTCVVRRIARRV